MAELLNSSLNTFTFNSVKLEITIGIRRSKVHSRSLHCVLTEDNRRAIVKNGKDSLDICRVVNGM